MQLTGADWARPPLRHGERSPRVAVLRELLVAAGEPADGCPLTFDLFDDALAHVVRAFQQRRGLAADGVVGTQTIRVLEGARWRLGSRVLMHTKDHLMRGDDVSALQERLVVLGLLAGPVDGLFGSRTDAALRELQRSLGLEPDGRCAESTLHALAALARSVGGGDPWALRQQAEVAGAGVSLAGKVVLLDPAHGGEDPGTVGWGLTEAEVVFDLAERVAARLRATGGTAVLSRAADTGPDELTRAALADEVGADVVLSLHCDGHHGPQARGVASFYWGDVRVGTRSVTGAALATLVQSEIVARTGLVDLRAHACTFDIVRVTRMPAVQIELGYLTNPQDARLLADSLFRDCVAEALLIAVQRLYLGDQDAETGTLQLRDVLSNAGLA